MICLMQSQKNIRYDMVTTEQQKQELLKLLYKYGKIYEREIYGEKEHCIVMNHIVKTIYPENIHNRVYDTFTILKISAKNIEHRIYSDNSIIYYYPLEIGITFTPDNLTHILMSIVECDGMFDIDEIINYIKCRYGNATTTK